ncbi:MAG: 50S ribosomal protein L23 [Pseudomonadota bacterium]
MNPYNVLKRPLITEKVAGLQTTHNAYAFIVDKRATKFDIKSAVESVFKVKVLSVKTLKRNGKYKKVGKSQGRTSDLKKAIVKLNEGDRIEGMEIA